MADIKQIKVGSTNYTINADKLDGYHSSSFSLTSHTHDFSDINSRGEAFLSWGGQSLSDSYAPVDAAMVSCLGAIRSAFLKAAGVVVEYSRDGGSTWTDYGATDSQKVSLFSGISSSFSIGKATSAGSTTANYKLRITINTGAAQIYTTLNKFVVYVSTNGSSGTTCTIQGRLQSNYESGTETWVTFANKAPISGWSGYNVINTSGITTYGNTKASQYGQVRFIFENTSCSTSYSGLIVSKIMCFGGVGWTAPSTMASTGLIYSYDSSQNVSFPAKVSATSFTGNLTGNVTGNVSGSSGSCTGNAATATTASKLGTNAGSATQPVYFSNGVPVATTYSLAKSVPSNAVFTDTHYTNSLTIKGAGTAVTTFAQSADKALDIVAGSNITVTPDATNGKITIGSTNTTYSAGTGLSLSGTTFNHSNSVTAITTAGLYKVKYDAQGHITGTTAVAKTDITGLGIPGSDTNTAHSHSAGVGLVGSGSAGTSGTYTYKAALADETLDTNAAVARPTTSTTRLYPVVADKNGKLATLVPWTDTDTHYTYSLAIKGAGTTVTTFAQNASKSLDIVAGSNVTVTPDATNGKITIASTNTDTHYTHALTIQGNGTTATTFSQSAAKTLNIKPGSNVTVSAGTDTITIASSYTDTKNTAGSTDTSSKIFLVGATSQAANPQTYSHDTAYVGTDGCLYSGGTKVLTAHQDISGKADKASITAGTAGTSSATSGSSLAVPYVTMNAQGIVTGYGTHTHTVTGFAAASHTHNYAGSSSAGGAATSANKVNAAVTFNNGGSGVATGTTFDGSTARTVSYNSIGAASATALTNLSEKLKGNVYREEQGTSPAYTQNVPQYAKSKALLSSIGGKSVNSVAQKCDKVVSYGKNLFNPVRTTNVGDTGVAATYPNWPLSSLTTPGAYSISNNYNTGSVTFYEDGFVFTSGGNGNSLEIPFAVEPNTTYTLSFTPVSTYWEGMYTFDASGTFLGYAYYKCNTPFTTEASVAYIVLRLGGGTRHNVQLEKGSVVTDFEYYRDPVELTIPTAVQNLDGYGTGNDTIYSELLLEPILYPNMKSVDLGTLDYTYDNSGSKPRFYTTSLASTIELSAGNLNLLSRKYAAASSLDKITGSSGTNDYMYEDASGYISFPSGGATTAPVFKASVSGIILHYKAREGAGVDYNAKIFRKKETDSVGRLIMKDFDVTSYFPEGDIFLDVSGGSTLTFHQTNGTTTELPNKITYMVDVFGGE